MPSRCSVLVVIWAAFTLVAATLAQAADTWTTIQDVHCAICVSRIMLLQDISNKKQDSAWWFDEYARSQKQDMGGKGMAHGERGMAGMTETMKGMNADSTAKGGSPSGMGTVDDVGLMGMMNDDMSIMGAIAIGRPGSKSMKGLDEMRTASSQPGLPGISRLYHIGAAGFFLNHSEHVTLSNKQQESLNIIKRNALLSRFTAQRKIEEAEQELWEMTGADMLNATLIQAKVQAIEELRGEQRMALIQSVAQAAAVLTDKQRQSLLGASEPVAATSK